MKDTNKGQGQVPLELFGYATTNPCPDTNDWKKLKSESAKSPYKLMPCPFVNANCSKIRKAKPNALIGNCTVRVCGSKYRDWIVCPKRLNQDDIIFKDCLMHLRGSKEKVFVASELKIGEYGNLDFGIIGKNKSGEIDGFVGLEVQTMGTSNSGSIWDARNDYLKNKMKNRYNFNVNIKDASKKILVQLLHKGSQIARWRSTMVLAIQDCFLDHLKSTYNIVSHFHNADSQDFIHIHAYSLNLDEKAGRYTISLSERISTDLLGLSMCLISNPATKYYKFKNIEARVNQRLKEVSAGKNTPIKELQAK